MGCSEALPGSLARHPQLQLSDAFLSASLGSCRSSPAGSSSGSLPHICRRSPFLPFFHFFPPPPLLTHPHLQVSLRFLLSTSTITIIYHLHPSHPWLTRRPVSLRAKSRRRHIHQRAILPSPPTHLAVA